LEVHVVLVCSLLPAHPGDLGVHLTGCFARPSGGLSVKATTFLRLGEIDDRELSWDAFGRLSTSFSGWGARIIFVPDDEIHLDPKIEVGEPEPRG
ncbi:MAG: hypothetical protein JNL82_39505, partial [Myxococcales bacterium]|nr:hypothetical protein [Myxococcales bacterium]